MRRLCFFLILSLPLLSRAEGAAPALPKGMAAALQARVARGQEIYEYERLAWLASDALMAASPDRSQVALWVEVPSGNRRYIFFGRFKGPQDPPQRPEGFSVAYLYWAPLGKPEDLHPMASPKVPGPAPDPELLQAMKQVAPLASAAELIRHDPSPWGLPWNYDVFREPDGTITGYLMPGNTDPKVIPLGGDFRITLDASGTRRLRTVALHRSYLPMKMDDLPKGAKAQGGWHSHVLEEDLPPETDLATLRLYPGGLPHYLLTRYGLFCLTPDHQLLFLETKEELAKEAARHPKP